MYLSGTSGGTQENQLKLGNPSPAPFLPMEDSDSTEHASSLCDMQSRPSLQPRLAFGGSPFSVNSQSTCMFLPQTSFVSRKQHVIQSLTVAAQLSAQKDHTKQPVVSPTSVCTPMNSEDTFGRSLTSSPPAKKPRWLPPLGPASRNEQPLFSAQREETGLDYSSWFSTNPELFATLAESSLKS